MSSQSETLFAGINHPMILADGNKCTAQTANIRGCHDTALFHVVIQKWIKVKKLDGWSSYYGGLVIWLV